MAALSHLFRLWCKNRLHPSVEVLVFGIGNPGRRYQKTRHNAGFMVVDQLPGNPVGERRIKGAAFTAVRSIVSGRSVACVKPTTFVNRCGQALLSSSSLFDVELSSCLVVVDDYNLPLGTIRLRRGGSDGGHHGLASIIESCGPDFPRLRIGIGPLPQGVRPVDFVLGAFTEEEVSVLASVVKKAAEAVAVFCAGGIEKAMNMFNRSEQKDSET